MGVAMPLDKSATPAPVGLAANLRNARKSAGAGNVEMGASLDRGRWPELGSSATLGLGTDAPRGGKLAEAPSEADKFMKKQQVSE